MRTVLFRTISVVVFAVLGSNAFAISLPSFLKLSNEKSESAPVVPNLPPNFCSSTSVLSIRKNKTTSFSSIQAAVNASQEDAEIFVPQGTWKELVKVQHKEELTISTPCRAQIYGFSLSNSHRIDIQGFVIVGAPAGSNGIEVAGGNHSDSRINIANNEITSIKSGYSAISIAPSDSHIQITGNNIHNNQGYGIYFASAFFGGSYLIQGNTIINNGFSGITIPENTKAVISQNTIKFNGVATPNTIKAYGIAIIKSKDCKDDDHKDHDDRERLARKISLVSNKIIFNYGLVNKESTRDIGNFEVLYAKNDSGNLTTSGTEGGGIAAFVDVTPPIIIVVTQGNVLTNQPQFNIQATITDESPITVNVMQNGVKVASSNQYSLSYNATLQEGLNNFSIQAVDYYGNTSVPILISNVRLDTTPPTISLGIANGASTNQNTINLPVTVTDASPTSTEVDLDGIKILTTSSTQFSQPIQLASIGTHNVRVTATDAAGNSSTVQITVNRISSLPPVASLILKSSASGTAPFMVLLDGTQSTDPQGQALSYNWDFGDGESSQDIGLATHLYKNAGSYVIRLTVTDQYGLSNSKTVSVQASVLALPQDPKTLAPPLVQNNIKAPFVNGVSFLYSGSNPTQTNVNTAAIDPTRVSVMRGQVVDDNGQPISGVKVTVNGGVDFGQTLTGADGFFNMAVNGGGPTTVQYEKPGYLPAQRTIKVFYNDFATVEKAILVATDSKVTKIQNGSGQAQIAKGSASADDDGQRTAVLMIPPSTTASIELPNGGTMELPSLSLRMTEYTVGASGPERMPASLPTTTSYTYAVDITSDEALALGAKHIHFSQPVSFYVDNFLGFPVGMAIPVGSYDYDKGAWQASENGRVIKVLSVNSGKAVLDISGNGQASAADLATLGITDDELIRIASSYPAGSTFWRARAARFSPFDLNVLAGSGGVPPTEPPDSGNTDEPVGQCPMHGSKIDVLSQNLGEELPVIGTDLKLMYNSKNSKNTTNTTVINITGDKIPADLQQIDLTIEVAGRVFQQTYTPATNLSYTFVWDGLDVYGRSVDGKIKGHVTIGYRYPQDYLTSTLNFPNEFDTFGVNLQDTRVPGRDYALLSGSYDLYFGKAALPESSAGEWTISNYHHFDPQSSILYYGDGSSLGGISPVFKSGRPVEVVMGDGTQGTSPDGNYAINSRLSGPFSLRLGKDRSIYFSENSVIRRIKPDGTLQTIAGTLGKFGYTGDGGPATQATLSLTEDVAIVEGDGNEYYIADEGNHVIRKVDKNGIISTFAGNGTGGFSGDGGPATQAQLEGTPLAGLGLNYYQGSLFIWDFGNARIRQVTPDGIIRTVVGNGTTGGDSPDGTQAANASITYTPHGQNMGMGFTKDGELVFVDDLLIRKVNRLGQLVTIAGSKSPVGSQDGILADTASIGPTDIKVMDDGSIYWVEGYGQIRYMAPDGTLQTLAGNGRYGAAVAGAFAKDTSFSNLVQFDISQDGNVYVTEAGTYRILKIPANLNPKLQLGYYKIPSSDGSEIYYFDQNGIHTKTTYGATDTLKYEFEHDANNNLIAIKDAWGNATTFGKDSTGNVNSITSPYGQITNLTYDAQNRLAQMTLPNGDSYRMGYYNNNLLNWFIKPNGAGSNFGYNTRGDLVYDQNAAGGFTSLTGFLSTTMTERISTTTAQGISETRSATTAYGGSTDIVQSLPTGEQVESTSTSAFQSSASNTNFYQTNQGTNDQRLGQPALSPFYYGVLQGSNQRNEIYSRHYDRLNDISDYKLREDHYINSNIRETTTFDSVARTMASISALGRGTSTQYNDKMQPVSSQLGTLTPTSFQYDSNGNLIATSRDDRSTLISYGSNGMPQSIQDSLGNKTSFEYDQNLRKTKVIYPNGSTVAYQYDGNNNVTSITPAGRSPHLMNFNLVDLLTSYIPPELGGQNTTTSYQYDLDQRMTLIQRPDGQQIKMQYDPTSGQLSQVQTSSGNYSFAYDLGRLSTASSPDGISTSVGYVGKIPTTEMTSGNAFSFQVSKTINALLQTSSVTAGGIIVNYGYDSDEMLVSAGSENLFYDSNSLLQSFSVGNVVQTNSYNNFGELSSLTVNAGTSAIFSQILGRDKNGRISSLSEGPNTTNYTYDNLGRLVDVATNGYSVGHYTYDDNGNRTSATIRGKSFSASYDGQDRMTSYGTKSYVFDAAGELASVTDSNDNTSSSYSFDSYGNLKQATIGGKNISYLTDAQNRRVAKKVNGQLSQVFVYQSQTQLAALMDGNSNVVARFVYASKSNAPDYMIKAGANYRIVTDPMGSVRAVVDVNTGAVMEQISYDEFGQILSDTNPGFQPFGFAGGLYDQDTKLVHFGARDYDPETGRWTAKDPILFSGGDTNLYGYSLNDPVNGIDPTGLWYAGVSYGGSASVGYGFGGGSYEYGSYSGYSSNGGATQTTYKNTSGGPGLIVGGGVGGSATLNLGWGNGPSGNGYGLSISIPALGSASFTIGSGGLSLGYSNGLGWEAGINGIKSSTEVGGQCK